MTSDASTEGLGRDDQTATDGASPSLDALLAMCDRVLGELGRRRHLFGWLRAPDAAPDEWLAVDAYYPANRLVVCGPDTVVHGDLYRALVAAHGLRLLELDPARFSAVPAAIASALVNLIGDLGPAPERAREAPLVGERGAGAALAESAIARVAAAFAVEPHSPAGRRQVPPSQAAAAERGARFVAAHRGQAVRRPAPQPRRPIPSPPRRTAPPAARQRSPAAPVDRQRSELGPLSVLLGLVTVAVVLAEVYLGVGRLGLDDGLVLLGFGLALDSCARALGAAAARRVGREQWAWACALGGSPAVAAFALFRAEGPVRVDPAPLAGLISLLAIAVTIVALVAAALGG